MKCSFNKCENNATIGIGWGLSKGTIPICKECYVIYSEHLKAVEEIRK